MRGRARRKRSRALAAALLLTACGGDRVVLGDGRTRSSSPRDAASEIPTFTRVTAIDSISAPGTVDDDPSLTSDLDQIYFDSKRDGGAGEEDIWRSSRTSPADDWGPPEAVTELNTKDRETGIALSDDALTIWFSSNRTGTLGGLDVFVSARKTILDPWPTAVRVDELSSSDDDLVSAVDSSQTTLLLARRSSSSSDYDIYASTRADTGSPWNAPAPIEELNSSKAESDAFPLENGTALIFTRAKDLVLASRPDPSAPYRIVGPLSSLNSSDDDRDAWSTNDMSYVVFSSNRSGDYLLYEARP